MTKEQVNRILLDHFGNDLLGKPKFQVVWSTDETEIRVGKFDEYYGGVYVRTIHGAKEWKKYSYLPDKWVLEQLVPTSNPELKEKLSYEPIYVFQDKDGNYLPLNLDVAIAVVTAILNRVPPKPRSEAQDLYEEEEKARKEKEQFKKMLKDHDSEFERRIRNQELILNPLSSQGAEK